MGGYCRPDWRYSGVALSEPNLRLIFNKFKI